MAEIKAIDPSQRADLNLRKQNPLPERKLNLRQNTESATEEKSNPLDEVFPKGKPGGYKSNANLESPQSPDPKIDKQA